MEKDKFIPRIMLSPIEITNAVDALGYYFIPCLQDNGKYKIMGWKNEKCLGLGKYEYTDWKVGINKTYKDFYNKFILKLNQ